MLRLTLNVKRSPSTASASGSTSIHIPWKPPKTLCWGKCSPPNDSATNMLSALPASTMLAPARTSAFTSIPSKSLSPVNTGPQVKVSVFVPEPPT